MKSGRFQVKSTHNLIKSDVSTKTLQFGGVHGGGYDPRFHEIQGHSPSPAFIKLDSFGWNTCFYKVLGGFQMKSTGFHLKSARFHADFMWNRKTHLQRIATLCFDDLIWNTKINTDWDVTSSMARKVNLTDLRTEKFTIFTKDISLRTGFEPARGVPIGFQVQRLNHSAIAARMEKVARLKVEQDIDKQVNHYCTTAIDPLYEWREHLLYNTID